MQNDANRFFVRAPAVIFEAELLQGEELYLIFTIRAIWAFIDNIFLCADSTALADNIATFARIPWIILILLPAYITGPRLFFFFDARSKAPARWSSNSQAAVFDFRVRLSNSIFDGGFSFNF